MATLRCDVIEQDAVQPEDFLVKRRLRTRKHMVVLASQLRPRHSQTPALDSMRAGGSFHHAAYSTGAISFLSILFELQ
jgi:hypothetical protein